MKLDIKYKPTCKERPWLIVRVGGEYEQHAHMHTRKEAMLVRNIIDRWVYPYNKNLKIAVRRIQITRQKTKILQPKQRIEGKNSKVNVPYNNKNANLGHCRK